MDIAELFWLYVTLLWSYAESRFPDIDDVSLEKYSGNLTLINTNLNFIIHCSDDQSKILYESKFVNCSSNEFNVIYKGGISINVSYNVDKSKVTTSPQSNRSKMVIYDGSGQIIFSEITANSLLNVTQKIIRYNETLLRCITPILSNGEYYNYKCWKFRVNYPITSIAIAMKSFKNLKNKRVIIWHFNGTEPTQYFVKFTNILTNNCLSGYFGIKSIIPNDTSECKKIETRWIKPNKLEIRPLDPVSLYVVTLIPIFNSTFGESSEIHIKSHYGSKHERCFADCIFKLHDGSIRYTGIRQVNSAGNVCYETCSTKQFADQVTCPRFRVHSKCDIPYCTYYKSKDLASDCLTVSFSSKHNSVTLSWKTNIPKSKLTGYIVLFYSNYECVIAYVFTKLPIEELSLSVRSFFIPCSKIKTSNSVVEKYKFDYVYHSYSSYIIPVINKNTTGFVVQSVLMSLTKFGIKIPTYTFHILGIVLIGAILLSIVGFMNQKSTTDKSDEVPDLQIPQMNQLRTLRQVLPSINKRKKHPGQPNADNETNETSFGITTINENVITNPNKVGKESHPSTQLIFKEGSMIDSTILDVLDGKRITKKYRSKSKI